MRIQCTIHTQDTLFEGDILVRGDTSSREDLLALLHDPSFLWPRGEVMDLRFEALEETLAGVFCI